MKTKLAPWIISSLIAILVTAAVCAAAIAARGAEIDFCASYYFVCYAKEDNAVSAGAISEAVSEFGGAGYTLAYGGNYYATVACYYDENDANTVCKSLNRQNMRCTVLAVELDGVRAGFLSKRKAGIYKGNLNTLHSLSDIAYGCANALDKGEMTQSKAKSVLKDIRSAINGLQAANGDNCFCGELWRLDCICENIDGYIRSKELRNLQIAIADTIINIKLA